MLCILLFDLPFEVGGERLNLALVRLVKEVYQLLMLRHRSVKALLVLSGSFVGLSSLLFQLCPVLLVALGLLLDEPLMGL